MSSSQLVSFNKYWKKQWASLSNHHYDERVRYETETESKKQSIIDNARAHIEALRRSTTPADAFDDEVRKIQRSRDAALEAIEREFNEQMLIINEIQEREQATHKKNRSDALAARSRMNNTSPAHSIAATTTTTIDDMDMGATSSKRTPSASQTPTSKPPGPWIHPSRDSTPGTTTSREQDQSAAPGKAFSCTVQREFTNGIDQYILRYKTKNRKGLQEVAGFRAKPSSRIEGSVDPPPTPISAASLADEIIQVSRTVTFEEVYQNGQAEHKDTIVEFPPDSCQWYIIKCEEHGIRFNQRPLQGAAKHLNGRDHGGLDKSWPLALKILGYRVLNCNEQLAAANNKAVREAFEKGYKPENRRLKLNRDATKKASENVSRGASNIRKKGAAVLQAQGRGVNSSLSSSLSSPGRRKASQKDSGKIITNPKTFHIYYCLWRHHRYPVMILGWDDQKPGGLDLDLVDTGLLAKKSKPPGCYIYKNNAIVDWSPRFKDGGSRVNRRKFPAMFFDVEKRVSWVPASWLNEAEIAPSVSSLSDDDDSGSCSDAESSERSSASNVTERELQELQAKAGEISGDSDYSASDMDSTLGDEYDDWDEVESDGRPWAFYSLRNKANDSPQKAGPSAPTHSSRPADVNPIREGMKAARNLSARACSQEDYDSEEEDTDLEKSPRDELSKGTADDKMSWTGAVENVTQKDSLISSSTAVARPNPLRVSTSMVYATDADNSAGGLSSTSLTSTPSLSKPSPHEEILKGLKRARSEEQSEVKTGNPEQESAKKPKVGLSTSGNQVAIPLITKPLATPTPTPVVASFKPKSPPGPAVFELSFYSKGPISWSRESEASSVRLYYGEGDGIVGSIDGPVSIIIDPANLRALAQEKIPELKGNVRVTLLDKDPSDTPATLVFDRAKGSKMDIGKIQVRSFIRWLKGVNQNVRLLDG
ncbi:hypothetical protein O1611_g7502 [Lasiodiplodia mahajangana]|uniref:Uncharacterized protein n=1 Tax=Lasiodiplodia mahajangana TaxID=1108764 RepID=A0ACC2JFD9_9PEZI|nr:hypothetical protein O1611_g7502 [Lasiodiplodia mahajangana]